VVLADAGDSDPSAEMTVLHVAARHGLRSFAERLSTMPAAAAAAAVTDFDRQTPGHLARCHGNDATADVIDRLTNQRAASHSASEYRTLGTVDCCFVLQRFLAE